MAVLNFNARDTPPAAPEPDAAPVSTTRRPNFAATVAAMFGSKSLGYIPAPPPPPPQPLAKVNLSDLRSRFIQAPLFIVADMVPSREVTLLPADGGTGKSQLMLQLAVCMALGRPFMGKQCVHSKVIYYSAEDEELVLLHRLRKVCDHMNLSPREMEELNNWLHVADASENPSLFCEVSDRAMGRMFMTTGTYESLATTVQAMRGQGMKRVSVIVDNASDTFDANENARQEVRKFIRHLKVLARLCDGAVVLLAHLDKASVRDPNGKAQFSGSTAWHNSVRSRLLLVRSEAEADELLLSQEKNNYGKSLSAPIRMRWNDAGVLEHIPRDGTEPVRLDAEGLRDHILGMVREHYERGQFIGTGLSTNTTTGVWSVLSAHGDFPYQLQAKGGKDRLHKIVRQAVTARLIEAEVYDHPTRRGHKAERWRVVTTSSAPDGDAGEKTTKERTGIEANDGAE